MKIEKLTEDKIRVIIHSEELGGENINIHNIMRKAIETQEIFSMILKEAEKKVDFHTEGCKLFIEAFSSLEDALVFTITKYVSNSESKKKKLMVKRKTFDKTTKQLVCLFDCFDSFCEFSNAIRFLHNLNLSEISKSSSLYWWKDRYYLILKNVNSSCETSDSFYSSLSEFGKFYSYSEPFEAKLLEHGKPIIKKNALITGMKFFKN